ncbi:MAG: UDP-N-acetylglucosamine 1-carboxyvinyltransferase [Phenylobacterium sp.]|uniref:UDP-N-acetylglucosamine 1-carboxyvinyltransferase n=1 Tax=Phenylobacterium sp. TaxID=1871053 RepID=UPI0025E43990|nr:UDP-N-acetylglucosamine 1-carboxyvinyltransferase [Phenylobacterium sp.]MCA3709833.1 UDP-N-acetylglucosamine 1-carboxyvinyltransferase [Phenylobacterium sp.]MCA3711783.1 UDP-N-acetylglucosamine 1-carboxyvinyltransferase [Phenylobacterium sp.]MCA3716188.1 UDP-N-acetylglucosamine 1-carboxyvinyltransferase [Phenylobacterium sp.]MCA3724257.1 UDP-N-acetylglucosamine 1-carboxyvinyltransferase [Phenylobacterium sp.]MCA3727661.1 UDP-N-acetylglucosamine 1-carboxyvinyltransferase [Phenylobacterium sp
MTSLIVNGGRALRGRIIPSANKNAVLPVLCATLLTDQPVTLHRVPDITDVRKILDFFRNLGSTVDMDFEAGTLRVRHGEGLDPKAAHLPLGMRSTLMLIPPLLHRFGAATIEEDATGCTLGAREIDPHIEVLQTFGATVRREPDALHISVPGGYRSADHWLDYASVTTTENFMLCAATASGRSKLTNAACEPHVQEFCAFLALMGARIEGVGGSRIVVEGVDRLSGAEFTFADDFHEVATFLAMGAITGGEVSVRNGSVEQFPLLDRTFAKFGVEVTHEGGWSSARAAHGLKVREPFTSNILTKVEAAPWPYVPADLLPIFIALGVRAEGSVMFWNKVYEGALGWSSEIGKFGAHAVLCDPHRLITYGGKPLMPATVESPYIIRVAIALFMLAASIEGRSTILNAAPIQRAHPRFVENLNALGADVEWVAGD